jgi:Putative zinc-finger
MNCRRVQRLLFDFQDGLLSGQVADGVAAHLRDCHACRRLRDAATAAEGKLRAMSNRQPKSHRSLRHEALCRWSAERQGAPRVDGGRLRTSGSRRPATWSRSLGAAAGVVLVGVITLSLGRWDHTPSNVASTSSAGDRSPAARRLDLARTMRGSQPAAHPPVNGGPVRFQSRLKAAGIPEPAPDLPPASAGFANSQAPRLRGEKNTPLGRPDHAAHDVKPATKPWTAFAGDAFEKIEAVVRRQVPVRDDFVRIPFPRIAATSDPQIAAAVESYQREAAIIDARLAREVTVLQKGTALSDLCDHLRADTGIRLAAGSSVADEKITLFCQKLPLRDVMRQLSRPFGYTWLRSGKTGEYKYELVQDLRSQLLEEELRNRDRNAALLALEQELEKYRPYLNLSPDEALARAKTAPPAEKALLENLAGLGYGPIQMYFRLSPREMAAIRAGQWVACRADPRPGDPPLPRLPFSTFAPGERPLPPDVAHGILQNWRQRRVAQTSRGPRLVGAEEPDSVPLPSFPGIRAWLTLTLAQSELGQFSLEGDAGFWIGPDPVGNLWLIGVGRSPKVVQPENETVNTRLAGDPDLRPPVTVQLQPSCRATLAPGDSAESLPEPKVTMADVLEALHRATGLALVADAYTRLYKPETVSVRSQSRFAALNRLSDAMRLRWNKEGSWLQFRSTSFYDDRFKEVPNRLLTRWAAARRQHGFLTLEDLVEIAQLSDAQLKGAEMAEGARLCYGLAEWDMARDQFVLSNLRFLAQLTLGQRQETMTTAGFPLTRMTLAQQQEFLDRALGIHAIGLEGGESLQSLEDLAGATLRVDYRQPGWYEWQPPGARSLRWLVPLGPPPDGRRLLVPMVRERTREAAVQALRRVDPQIREAVWKAMRRSNPQIEQTLPSDEAQIVPIDRADLVTLYIPGSTSRFPVQLQAADSQSLIRGW